MALYIKECDILEKKKRKRRGLHYIAHYAIVPGKTDIKKH